MSRPLPVLLVAMTVLLLALGTSSAEPPASQTAAGTSEADQQQTDQARYVGRWRVVSIEANGEVKAENERQVIVTNRLDGSWSLSVDGREIASGTNTMDPLATPKEIDIEITAGDGSGSILRGIYEIGEQTRRLCFRGGNGWRPREFSGASGTDSVLVLFERQ